MRIQTVVFGCALLVLSLVLYSDAVPCSDTVTTDCTDCTLPANAADPDCLATTTVAATTLAAGTTTVATGVTTTTVSSGATTTSNPSRLRLLRRLARLRLSLIKCRRNAAKTRIALRRKINSLMANRNTFPSKFLG
ncbi:uncharacterized protein LOC117792892 [Drosophila innubila]|uniref:uncharacterized protein LOC117792892 n=1 Tax=Drosophila innubila TaxID=198719 RepID=UPI00148E17D7|nr:uncharacterized protein LOC117792892 [Drosophila innubila]